MKQAQGNVSKDNWDFQAAQVYRMNLVPKGRFLHGYFCTMRKPLKITSPSPFLCRDANSPDSLACIPQHAVPSNLELLTCFKLVWVFSLQNSAYKFSGSPPGRTGAPKTSVLQHSNRIAGNSLSCMPYTLFLPCPYCLKTKHTPQRVGR